MKIAFKTAQALIIDNEEALLTKEEVAFFHSQEFQPDYFVIEAESENELRAKIAEMVDKLCNTAFGRAQLE